MISAKALSEAIRMKRKKVKEAGVDNMLDTAPGPQMNPQDIYNLKQQAVREQLVGSPEKSKAPDDPADPGLDETQKVESLKKHMARIARILGTLSVG
jgi:hypothetical protein